MSDSLIATKTITVYNTLGQNESIVRTTASTWRQLQQALSEQGISYSSMKAVVGETQVTLESPDAQLPEQDFTLFMFPQKVRSGGWEDDDEVEDLDFEDEPDEELVFDNDDDDDTSFLTAQPVV